MKNIDQQIQPRIGVAHVLNDELVKTRKAFRRACEDTAVGVGCPGQGRVSVPWDCNSECPETDTKTLEQGTKCWQRYYIEGVE